MLGEWTREKAYRHFESEGEEYVRAHVERGSFHGDLMLHARSWLRGIDDAREAIADSRKEASRAEEMRIARSAKNAAWVAAISAMTAIAISIISLVLSLRSAAHL